MGRKAMLAYLAIAGIFLLGLILFAHIPVWAVLVALAAITAVFLWKLRRQPLGNGARAPVVDGPPAEASPPPIKYEQASVTDIRLPSNRDDYEFLFSATILWALTPVPPPGIPPANPRTAASFEIVRRAREITERSDPGRVSLVAHELSLRLGELREDPTGRVRAMTESVQLTIPEDDYQRLEKLAAIRKEEDVWDHERRFEKNKREYLGKDVLKSPGSAVVWWIARNEGKVAEAASNIGVLSQISYAANDNNHQGESPTFTSEPTPPKEQTASASPLDYLESFLSSAGFTEENSDERLLVAGRIAAAVALQGREELASEIRKRFDQPGEDELIDEEG